MDVLIHARCHNMYELVRPILEKQQHRVHGAFSLEEGREKMQARPYDKIFIDVGVSANDRLSLMALAGDLDMSMIEIISSDTVSKEILRVNQLRVRT